MSKRNELLERVLALGGRVKDCVGAVNKVREHATQIGQVAGATIDALKMDLIQTQQRIGNNWNVINAALRVIQIHGIENGMWKDEADFLAKFKEASMELMREALEHNQAEIARMQEAQANGEEPDPMTSVDQPLQQALGIIEEVKDDCRDQAEKGESVDGEESPETTH